MKQALFYTIGKFTFIIPLDEADDTPHQAMLEQLFDTIASMTDGEVAEAIAEELEPLDEYGDPRDEDDEWRHYEEWEDRRGGYEL